MSFGVLTSAGDDKAVLAGDGDDCLDWIGVAISMLSSLSGCGRLNDGVGEAAAAVTSTDIVEFLRLGSSTTNKRIGDESQLCHIHCRRIVVIYITGEDEGVPGSGLSESRAVAVTSLPRRVFPTFILAQEGVVDEHQQT